MKHLASDVPLAGVIVLVFAVASAFGAVPLSSVQRTSTFMSNIVPDRFIIEVTDASQVPNKRSVSGLV